MQCESKIGTSLTFRTTLPNLDRFSKCSYYSANSVLISLQNIILIPVTPCTCNLYALWNDSQRKQHVSEIGARKGQGWQRRKCYFQQNVNVNITAERWRSDYPSLAHIQTPSQVDQRPKTNSFVKDTLFQTDSHVNWMPVHRLTLSLSHTFNFYVINRGAALHNQVQVAWTVGRECRSGVMNITVPCRLDESVVSPAPSTESWLTCGSVGSNASLTSLATWGVLDLLFYLNKREILWTRLLSAVMLWPTFCWRLHFLPGKTCHFQCQ